MPKVRSSDVIADAKAVDRGHSNSQHEMSIATFRKPEALIFKEKQETTISAWVCAACGFVEFYADKPRGIVKPKATRSGDLTAPGAEY